MAAIVLFVGMMFFGWLLVLLPGGDERTRFGTGFCSGSGPCDYSWMQSQDGSAGTTFWISFALACVLFLLTSGAFSRSGRSSGMVLASTRPVPRSALGTSKVARPTTPRLLGRWVIVLLLFCLGTFVGNGFWGIGLVTLAWLPSLFAERAAAYDLVTGTAMAEVRFDESSQSRPRPSGTAVA